jgi:uncharacterized membrane protein
MSLRRWNFEPRRIFVSGLLVLLPGVIAAYVLWLCFAYLDGLLQPIVLRVAHRRIPGLSFVVLISLVFAIGLVASNLLGARILRALSRWLERVPLFSPVYRALREVGQVFLGEKASAFRRAALLEWPQPGMYAVVFVMSESSEIAERHLGKSLVTVFLPTSPNPTTGFVQFVDRKCLLPLDLSVEQALKVVISGGAVTANRNANPGPPVVLAPAGSQTSSSGC